MNEQRGKGCDGGLEVKQISPKLTHDFILRKHYAQRLPSISFAFGLYLDGDLRGVCTIGKPASMPLCDGICGKEYRDRIYELNRLVVDDGLPKNSLSQFLSKSLKLLKTKSLVIVSYADTGMGHNGYIYQATNFLYTGISPGRTDKYSPGNKHPRHYSDEYSHLRKVRTAKHRYVYFTDKKDKELRSALKYKIEPYPKGDNERYVLGERVKTQIINKETGEIFYE